MSLLFLLVDPNGLGLDLTLSKICAAEVALVNNFVWNEVWTFNRSSPEVQPRSNRFHRFLLFNAICVTGIVCTVFLLHLFRTWLGWNLYLGNLLAIGIVTVWNFGMNARFNWGVCADPHLIRTGAAPIAERTL